MLKTSKLFIAAGLLITFCAKPSQQEEIFQEALQLGMAASREESTSPEYMQLCTNSALAVAVNPKLPYDIKIRFLHGLFSGNCDLIHGENKFTELSKLKNRALMWKGLEYPHLQTLTLLITLLIDTNDQQKCISSVDFTIKENFLVSDHEFLPDTNLLIMAYALKLRVLCNALIRSGADTKYLDNFLKKACLQGDILAAQDILNDSQEAFFVKTNNNIKDLLAESGNETEE